MTPLRLVAIVAVAGAFPAQAALSLAAQEAGSARPPVFEAVESWLEPHEAAPSTFGESEPIVSANDALLLNPAAIDAGIVDTADVEPAQATLPLALRSLSLQGSTRNGSPVSQRRPTSLSAGASVVGGLASIPYMIGDTGAGTCVGFAGLLDAELSHPTLACGRLNVAENNSPLPTDRFYMSYRHFHNASPVSLYQFREAHDVDRYTLASERTFLDGAASWEVRLPINYHVSNDIISIFDEISGAGDLVANPNREVAVGNLSIIAKCLLLESRQFALSGGLGVTVPTAPDVRYRVGFRGEVVYTDFPDFSVDSLTVLQMDFSNDTVYLAPFLSWLYAPRGRWFHQGFLQVETAANPSSVTGSGTGLNLFLFEGTPIGFYDYNFPAPTTVDLHAQTLLRLNLGLGCELARMPRADGIQRIVGLAELHYTSTLNDATISVFPTDNVSGGIVLADFQELSVGNQANRVDILNAALGVQAEMGPFVVTHGFVAPIRTGSDRGFDFEYNLQVQLPY